MTDLPHSAGTRRTRLSSLPRNRLSPEDLKDDASTGQTPPTPDLGADGDGESVVIVGSYENEAVFTDSSENGKGEVSGCRGRFGKCFRKGLVLKARLKAQVEFLLARVLLKPLGMTDAEPTVASRIERMAVSILYVFFKCIIQGIVELTKSWRWAAITFFCMGGVVPCIFYFAVKWRHAVLTAGFMVINVVCCIITTVVWGIMIANFAKDSYQGPKGLKVFSMVTTGLLVIAFLTCSIESYYFRNTLNRNARKERDVLESRLRQVQSVNAHFALRLCEVEELASVLEAEAGIATTASAMQRRPSRLPPDWSGDVPSPLVASRRTTDTLNSRAVSGEQNNSATPPGEDSTLSFARVSSTQRCDLGRQREFYVNAYDSGAGAEHHGAVVRQCALVFPNTEPRSLQALPSRPQPSPSLLSLHTSTTDAALSQHSPLLPHRDNSLDRRQRTSAISEWDDEGD